MFYETRSPCVHAYRSRIDLIIGGGERLFPFQGLCFHFPEMNISVPSVGQRIFFFLYDEFGNFSIGRVNGS